MPLRASPLILLRSPLLTPLAPPRHWAGPCPGLGYPRAQISDKPASLRPFQDLECGRGGCPGTKGQTSGRTDRRALGVRDGSACRALPGTGGECPPPAPLSFSGLVRSPQKLSSVGDTGEGRDHQIPSQTKSRGERPLYQILPPRDPSPANEASRPPSCW